MKQVRLVVMMAAVMILGACSGRQESLTGAYGDGILSGHVVVEGQSAEGIEVSVRGTGMTTTVAADGAFVFAGVPAEAELTFHRHSDGINASLRLDPNAGPVIVEVAGTTARRSSRRRSAGRGSGEAFQFEGIIRNATATSIVVFTAKKEEVTITLAADTVIRKGNRTLTVVDLIVGARVHVRARLAGEAYSAIEVKLQDDGTGDGDDAGSGREKVELRGSVASVAATSFVVTTSTGDVTVQLTRSTQIRRAGKKITLSDVTVGSTVEVEGRRVDATTIEAKKVSVED